MYICICNVFVNMYFLLTEQQSLHVTGLDMKCVEISEYTRFYFSECFFPFGMNLTLGVQNNLIDFYFVYNS